MITKNNANYKVVVDLYCILRTFNVSNYVSLPKTRMVSCRKREEIACAKRRTFSNSQKDQFKCLCGGPPTDFDIICTFNIEDLVPYRGSFDTSSNLFMDEPTHDVLSESPHYLHFL